VSGRPGHAVTRVLAPGPRVRAEVLAGGVARLVLARPEVRNAFDAGMIAELTAALAQLAALPVEEARVLVLQGEGPVFCAGGDLAWMKEQGAASPERNREDARALGRMFRALASFPAPVLCAVQGAAFGGGLGLAVCADFVLATADATFATSEVRIGLLPGVIGPYVVRRLGLAFASPLMLSGRRVGAREALGMGLAHALPAAGETLEQALARWIAEFLRAAPGAARSGKRTLLELAPLPDDARLEASAEAIATARASAEGQEGLRAFLAKAAPAWAPPPPAEPPAP
jgi:methylglutaconyl-CoA hydratase